MTTFDPNATGPVPPAPANRETTGEYDLLGAVQGAAARAALDAVNAHGATSREKWTLAFAAITVVVLVGTLIWTGGTIAGSISSMEKKLEVLDVTYVRQDVYRADRSAYEQRLRAVERQ